MKLAMSLFEGGGSEVVDPRVTPAGVVEALDEVEHGEFGFGAVDEARPIEQLAFERGEEALAHRVVVAVADRSHRRSDARVTTPASKGQRGVWQP